MRDVNLVPGYVILAEENEGTLEILVIDIRSLDSFWSAAEPADYALQISVEHISCKFREQIETFPGHYLVTVQLDAIACPLQDDMWTLWVYCRMPFQDPSFASKVQQYVLTVSSNGTTALPQLILRHSSSARFSLPDMIGGVSYSGHTTIYDEGSGTRWIIALSDLDKSHELRKVVDPCDAYLTASISTYGGALTYFKNGAIIVDYYQ